MKKVKHKGQIKKLLGISHHSGLLYEVSQMTLVLGSVTDRSSYLA